MIDKISIEKLFGRFDYEITLKEKVTIITGPNGYGKSTILKCIEAISQGDLHFFSRLNFRKIEILFNDVSKNITIYKNKNELSINNVKFPVNIFYSQSKFRLKRYPYIIEADGNRLLDRRTGKLIDIGESSFKQIIMKEVEQDGFFISDDELPKMYANIGNIADIMKDSIGKIYFIKEQRLIKEKRTRSEQEVINVIEELPNKFKMRFSEISSNYSSIANKLDSSYPNRLFDMESGLTEEEYNHKMIEMTLKFEKLRKYDISEMRNSANVVFKDEHAKALKIYFDDFDEKYKVYEDFIVKLDFFTDIINSKLPFNEIRISRENGIIVTDKHDKNRTMPLSQLSSGEKQEIVLFYELIFESTNDVLLLIDEPEISLHIVWQKMFMDDLLKIVEYKGIKVIVATHSPQIINNHWDKQIDLGELYGNQLNKSEFNEN